jgi:2-methylcitrate dehydratase PrpD
MTSCSEALASWAGGLRFEAIPEDLVATTKLRVLDVIGLALAGTGTEFGAAVRAAALRIGADGPCRILGGGDRVSVTAAAFANGALSQALEYDDTHNESIVHMSSPSVAAALALAETLPVDGPRFLAAIVLGSEIACRIGSVAPGQFHRRGFHPTGLFSTFGSAYLAGTLLGLDAARLANAAGIAGSFAAGLLECWVDGTQSKFLHPGWAAQSGNTAAHLAGAGATGPRTVLEGRFGLLASHLQSAETKPNFARITDGLGTLWESRRASFKPFPAAHVIHPYIDALLRLRRQHRIDPDEVREIVCPVAAYIVPIVCEPAAEKRRPLTDSHGRVSFQYTLAEAMAKGRIGKDAYEAASLKDPAILALADRVAYQVDPGFPGPERFKGVVRVVMKDGAVYEAVEEHNRGSPENPMSRDDIVAKFDENAAAALAPAQRRRLVEAVDRLEEMGDAGVLAALAARDHDAWR